MLITKEKVVKIAVQEHFFKLCDLTVFFLLPFPKCSVKSTCFLSNAYFKKKTTRFFVCSSLYKKGALFVLIGVTFSDD